MIESDLLYLYIPHEVISEHMVLTNNEWNMEIPKKFISEINDWSDLKEIDTKIDEFDKKYLDWNHDFPIMAFKSIRENGLLFPNTTFSNGRSLLNNGTHRMFMCGMNGYDYPMFVQIPYGKRKFELKCIRPIFTNNSHLILEVNLDKKEYLIKLDSKILGVVKA